MGGEAVGLAAAAPHRFGLAGGAEERRASGPAARYATTAYALGAAMMAARIVSPTARSYVAARRPTMGSMIAIAKVVKKVDTAKTVARSDESTRRLMIVVTTGLSSPQMM